MESLILQKLEEYGDSVVEGKNKKKKQKDRKVEDSQTKKTNPDTIASQPVPASTVVLSKRQKKKRRKKQKERKEENKDEDVQSDSEPQLSGHEKRLKEMSEQLGLGEFKMEMERRKKKKDEETKRTNEPEVVVFTSHKSKKKLEQKLDQPESSRQGPEFDMRQARFDVQKFGIKGFQGNQKEEAMTALLIKLGAKPPKNKYVNYKEYQETKQQQMLEDKQKKEMDRKLGYKIPKANRGKKRPRDRNDIGHVDGQVGMWKSGVQIVKKDDLKGFNKKAKLK